MTAASALRASPVVITRNSNPDRAAWDAYVRAHPQGSFFHLSGWGEAAKRAYGYEPHYLTAVRNGDLAGVLAMTEAGTPLLGSALVSTAFSVGGGPLADDHDVLTALLGEAAALGREKRAGYIECRSDFSADGWREKTGVHANFELPLVADDATALAAIPRKRRAEIRKAIEAANQGVLSVRHDGEPELFYRLYAQSLHRLGTPVFPKRFLDALLSEFPCETEISVVDHQGAPVAALLSFHFRDVILPYYVGATEAARPTRAFDYLYWSAMRRAADKGLACFNFGRSKINSGAYHYKKLWGAEPCSVTHRIKLINMAAMPNVTAHNPKFALFANLWPRLPLSVANSLGPLLAPNFP
ncbi:MAG: FemAB family PEP-CTERM system-associated protein [Oricola sp.]|jgi:FemAB-related protein (PEP-CTERM system-associated)|nr:FemAB family PEP-CTERM system-associated protein [Oricola sp.]